MENRQKSRKLLLVATVIAVLALSSVLVVFAAVLGTFNGNPVTVTDIASGTVQYSTDGGLTYSSDASFNVGSNWQASFALTSTSYNGHATLTWQLQKNTGTWTNQGTPITTTLTSISTGQTIYATADGSAAGNHDFGGDVSTGGSYRIVVSVTSG